MVGGIFPDVILLIKRLKVNFRRQLHSNSSQWNTNTDFHMTSIMAFVAGVGMIHRSFVGHFFIWITCLKMDLSLDLVHFSGHDSKCNPDQNENDPQIFGSQLLSSEIRFFHNFHHSQTLCLKTKSVRSTWNFKI